MKLSPATLLPRKTGMDEVSMLQIPRETNVGSMLPMLTRKRHIERLPNTKNQETNLIHFDMAHNIIDADRLRKEVKMLEKAAHKSALGCADSETRKFHEGKDFAYQHVGVLISSLQQEQQEVDLEKEIDNYLSCSENIEECADNEHYYVTQDWLLNMARYFYELGLSTRKED